MTQHRLACTCPTCGRHPALRVPDRMVELVRALPHGTAVLEYQCRCRTIYPIHAGAFHPNIEEAA